MPKLLGLIEYVIWMGLALLGVVVLQDLEWIGCPSDAFVCGSAGSTTWVGLIRILLLVGCLMYPVTIALFFATRGRKLRKLFDKQHRGFDVRKAGKRAALIAVPCILAIYLLTYEKVWATPDIIATREYIWNAPVKRRWTDVVALTTWCTPGARGAWNEGYELTFRDGGAANLSSNAGPLAEHEVAIFSALHGLRFDFDDSAVDRDCLSGFRAMATQRP